MTGNPRQPQSDDAVAGGQRAKSRYAKVPDEFSVHLMFEGGHREEVRFKTIQEFQKWYSGELVPKSASNEFITIPIKNIEGEYMVARPSRIIAIRVTPIYTSSIDRRQIE